MSLLTEATRKARNNHYCVVPGCSSRTGRGDNLKFFRVIRNQSFQTQRWIVAINKPEKNGKVWQPSQNSRICGLHFIGGKPSLNLNDSNSNPTLHLDLLDKNTRRTFDEIAQFDFVSLFQ